MSDISEVVLKNPFTACEEEPIPLRPDTSHFKVAQIR